LHYAEQFIEANLRQSQLGLKQVAIGIQCVKLRIDAAPVANVGQALAVFQSSDKLLLLPAALTRSSMRD
jgi:hypothetical protein